MYRRVDGEHARQVRGRVLSRTEAAAARQPAELEEQQVERHQGDPEDRHGHACEADYPDQLVQPSVPRHRGDDAKPDTDHHRQDDREQRQLDGRRDVLRQVGQHRAVALLGDTEVPVQQIPEIQQVLHRQRPVKPVLMPEGRHRGWVADGALAEVGGGGIAGH